MKTVDTRVEETRPEEDEVRLVELRKNGKAAEGGSADDVSHTAPPESLYKTQHKDTVPKEW